MGRDWDECRTEYCKKLAKIRLKLHTENINPNFSSFCNFGSVAQSVVRLLSIQAIRVRIRPGEKYFFLKYLELGLVGILQEK